MLKKTTLAQFLLYGTKTIYAQDIKKEVKSIETKMYTFTSKTGIITKFTDTKLGVLKLSYGDVAETCIRKINSGTASSYFYQIQKEGKYSSPLLQLNTLTY